jgi:hypothetical protein
MYIYHFLADTDRNVGWTGHYWYILSFHQCCHKLTLEASPDISTGPCFVCRTERLLQSKSHFNYMGGTTIKIEENGSATNSYGKSNRI